MRITQGTFSFLPDLTDEEIEKQIAYGLENNWAIMVEYTDDPHPRNSFWDMWKQPDFDLEPSDSGTAMEAVLECRKAYPNHYIKLVAYDPSLGRQSARLSFIVNRPEEEPGFGIERTESNDRTVRYTIKSYAVQQDSVGRRYGNPGDLATTRDPAGVADATPGRDSPIGGQDTDGGPAPYEDVAPEKDEGIGES